MKLAGDAEWPLTDPLVLTLNYYGPGKYDFGAGWGLEGSEFILPVSPHLAVCTQVGLLAGDQRRGLATPSISGMAVTISRCVRPICCVRDTVGYATFLHYPWWSSERMTRSHRSG
jgi:hypothetical protein